MSHLERRREVPSTFGELVRSDRDRGEAVNSIKELKIPHDDFFLIIKSRIPLAISHSDISSSVEGEY